jgi:hypothetical protein
MTNVILLIDEGELPIAERPQLLMRRTSVMRQTKHAIKSHRYEFLHDEDADFITYQQKCGDGFWQAVSTWMIPRTECQ